MAKLQTAQVLGMVALLGQRDEMSYATDAMIDNLVDILMQLGFARNKMVEDLNEETLTQVAPLYEELANKIGDVGEVVAKIANVVHPAIGMVENLPSVNGQIMNPLDAPCRTCACNPEEGHADWCSQAKRLGL